MAHTLARNIQILQADSSRTMCTLSAEPAHKRRLTHLILDGGWCGRERDMDSTFEQIGKRLQIVQVLHTVFFPGSVTQEMLLH